ncbi:tRNA methyltransferase 10 homolog B [Geodia barretti]|uniref:tRNA methyltransferase 10 homolog B n=1 Tax=Geodia barretti TaxID=519541 RepID=A0AA35T0Z5_GEOBA|nr:tRNA methyltransferase 10 homolog B [Geodia barretti]
MLVRRGLLLAGRARPCSQSVFSRTGTVEWGHEHRPRLVVDCGLGHLMTHERMEVTERAHDSLFSPRDIVYLSPDSEHDLEEVDRCKVYVVGGIVDRSSPSKNLTLHRARVAGLETARLPISRFMEFTKPSPHNLNLPINVVTSMLLDVYRGHEWPHVLQTHMPKRKGYRIKPALSYTPDRVHEQTP